MHDTNGIYGREIHVGDNCMVLSLQEFIINTHVISYNIGVVVIACPFPFHSIDRPTFSFSLFFLFPFSFANVPMIVLLRKHYNRPCAY